RWKVLLEHLDGGTGFEQCGRCDNCVRFALRLRAADAKPAEPIEVPAHTAPAACLAPGDAVRVRRYGKGVVSAADANSITVEFSGGQKRCFLPDYVERAPKRRTPGRRVA